MKRRDFLKSAVAAAAATAVPAFAYPKGKVKFCAFADIHFNPGVWPHGEIAFLDRILARAQSEKTDFTVQLGDFTHRVDRQEELDYIKRYNTFGQQAYHVLGNHDGERGEGGYRAAMDEYGMKSNCYSFDVNGWRFLVGDPNYFLLDGRYVHYEGRNLQSAAKTGRVESVCCIPLEQVDWIMGTVRESPYPCVFMSHESVERPGAVSNGTEIRRLFDEINRETPGKVRLVINGHHHCDHVRVMNDIVYLDLNSASYMYFAKRHDRYPREYVKKVAGAANAIIWNDPLSAIVTLDGSSIKIAGSSSTYYLGVTPQMAGYGSLDGAGRPIVPFVSSFEFTKSTPKPARTG